MKPETPGAAPNPIQRIVLTGFMGAGKTTVGAILAEQLGWRFVDIDEVLVESEGVSIAALFERDGETRFRRLEEQAIAGALDLEHAVIALGGGALESQSTRDRLLGSPGTHLVFLETPLEIALERCAQQPGSAVRPVLSDRAAIAERFSRRLEHYRGAHQTLSTAGRLPAELATLLLATLAAERPRS
jgi:shikimate kinase